MSNSFEMVNLFAVPVLTRIIPDTEELNRRLQTLILEREKTDSGMQRSNANGWHSNSDLLNWTHPDIEKIKAWISSGAKSVTNLPFQNTKKAISFEYNAAAWANVNRNGQYNSPHTHPKSDWSMVYYVSLGQPANSHPLNGALEFKDPRPRAQGVEGYNFSKSVQLLPKPGMFLIFPAWLEHMVHPFFGTGERISIAVNLTLKKFSMRDTPPA